ncbi:MAG: hypothetical protein ACJAVG_001136 [Rickettsiales bacterium]
MYQEKVGRLLGLLLLIWDSPILGSKSFKGKILFEKLSEDSVRRDLVLNRINKNKKLTTYQIVGLVSEIFSVNEDFVINRNKKGRQSSNIPRAFAMFLCQ